MARCVGEGRGRGGGEKTLEFLPPLPRAYTQGSHKIDKIVFHDFSMTIYVDFPWPFFSPILDSRRFAGNIRKCGLSRLLSRFSTIQG